jgi:hypothetical protein
MKANQVFNIKKLKNRTHELNSTYNLGNTAFGVNYGILLNIMFHTPMGRFQLELFIFITYFSTVVPFSSFVFFP